jgi:heat shock 70kDa protein 4
METDDKKEEGKAKTRKVKKQVRKGDLPIVSGTTSLDPSIKNSLLEKEAAMIMEDKLVADTEEKKNELETYIYDMRNKLDDQYADFASDEEKDQLRSKLTESEVCCPVCPHQEHNETHAF